MVEDIGLYEEVSVRLVNRHKDNSTVGVLAHSLHILNSCLVHVHAIKHRPEEFVGIPDLPFDCEFNNASIHRS